MSINPVILVVASVVWLLIWSTAVAAWRRRRDYRDYYR